mmetsp:Transcript_18979/g.54184  ORF Transcript_18979/g.54184 Transcript_18979/m.54184 type:complete len:204 (-) Transcript_18979:575-1186(-)
MPSRSSSPARSTTASLTLQETEPPPPLSIVAWQSAPATETARVSLLLNLNPPRHSKTAASTSFPTSAFAVRRLISSAAPHLLTPHDWCRLPKSWTSVCGPPARTSKLASSTRCGASFTWGAASSNAATAENRTASPGFSREGGSRAGSKSTASVRPSKCQPPGVSLVYTPVWPAATPTAPLGTNCRGVGSRGTFAKRSSKPPR